MEKAPRADFADELRGFALLGIALVNAPLLGMSMVGFVRQGDSWDANRFVEFAVVALLQSKFYLIFAFLFGYTAHRIMSGPGGRGVFARRLMGLAAIGVAHIALFSPGDILTSYALLGLFLLGAYRWSGRGLAIGIALAFAYSAAFLAANAVWAAPRDANDSTLRDLFLQYDAIMREGPFLNTALARMVAWLVVQIAHVMYYFGFALMCFFAGLAAARNALFTAPERFPHLWIWSRGLGLAVGLPLGLASAWLAAGPGSSAGIDADARATYGVVLGVFTAPLLSAGYAAWMLALRTRFPGAFAFLRMPGRMSLTVYVGQSALLSAIFAHWGGGYFGTLGTAATSALAIGVWLALAIFAKFWLTHFDRGPLEMLLKRTTGRAH
jgi:uncharacterized protein